MLCLRRQGTEKPTRTENPETCPHNRSPSLSVESKRCLSYGRRTRSDCDLLLGDTYRGISPRSGVYEGRRKGWGRVTQACRKGMVYPCAQVEAKRGTGAPVPLELWRGECVIHPGQKRGVPPRVGAGRSITVSAAIVVLGGHPDWVVQGPGVAPGVGKSQPSTETMS